MKDCEPVKPIVYYVDPATPDKWKPWVKKAIEDYVQSKGLALIEGIICTQPIG